MAKRGKKQQKQSHGFLYLLIIICIVCICYKPVTEFLQRRLPDDVRRELTIPDTQATADKKKVPATKKVSASDKRKAPAKASATKALSGKEILFPARLKNTPEKILHRRGYTVSYNRDLKIPNWVAWELTPEKLVERESRTDKFLPDPDLPENEAVTTDDYKRAGMDRGHMCPAGDNRWHWKAMQESFYMTNICPQNHNLNRGDWKELEEACREWARREGKIYIVCGPVLYQQPHRTIGKKHKITVPEGFFKVVLCTNGKSPKAIGFIYKNAAGSRPMENYASTVDAVERITGIDFFPALPDEIEKKVEAEYDLKQWGK